MGGSESKSPAELKAVVDVNNVVMFSGSMCPYCTQAAGLLSKKNVKFLEMNASPYRDALYEATGQTSVPSIWVKGIYIGGCNDGPEDWMGLAKCLKSGRFDEILDSESVN
jgi:glutaredoxin 3